MCKHTYVTFPDNPSYINYLPIHCTKIPLILFYIRFFFISNCKSGPVVPLYFFVIQCYTCTNVTVIKELSLQNIVRNLYVCFQRNVILFQIKSKIFAKNRNKKVHFNISIESFYNCDKRRCVLKPWNILNI